ncbi:unnamed protein product [Bursaphelenchus okinawaensis]|uniref:Uncharacterized protein n=1 Tax=Bursaphelenchus okinawaensis TaxID=465554 RepID=A0A811KUG8_9BILA|nr:unnamed protein product [Bursaphelenchus okinawaensis]CAG9112080.1 unnamed protein product [Bursaphelenchus okinawaensis]
MSGSQSKGKVKISHVIFDFDGILVDSEGLYSIMHGRMLAKWGKTFDLKQKLAIQGMRKQDEVYTIVKMNGLEGKVTIEEYERDVKPMPGADRLIRHLHKHKVPIAICTSSAADEFEIKTRKLKEWLDMIPLRILAGSDARVKRGKPNPDPYLVCAKDMGVSDVSKCIVFEDSVNGCKSALSAGMHCIMIPQDEFLCDASKAEIEGLRPKLDNILKSMADFKPEEFGLPAFD